MSKIDLSLDIDSLEILSQTVDTKGNIVIEVQSKATDTPCHKCGKTATKRYGYGPFLTIKHLPLFDKPVYLKIRSVRYQCEHCDDHATTSEQYDWCDRGSKTSKGLEKYLMRSLIHSTVQDVSRKEGLGYKSIVSILQRHIGEKVDWSDYQDLETIGIDEISLKKGYQDFLTIISAIEQSGRLTIIGILEGRQKKDVKDFFESIPKPLIATTKAVCSDMYDGFVQAAKEVFGSQAVVVDRYHVAKLYRAPLDKLRIKEMRRLKSEISAEEYSKLEGMMWILRAHHECLSEADKSKLTLLYKYSPALKEAHKCALKLTHIFNTKCNRKVALSKLNRWIQSVENSDVQCFATFIKTLKKYKSSILNYFKARKNSGFVEGLNNKIKVAKRRCYGFFKPESLFQRMQLDLIGFDMYA
jgi:transposase|tara:strand:+ start:1114 stop:2352 length:1239 start_codon:yes stop_codon:yes gene_type:complete